MSISKQSKVMIIVFMLVICLAFVVQVWVTARAAEIQYELNTINKQIQATQREVQNLEVKIKSASNINNLETKAEELGMVYPSFDQIVYLQTRADIDDFATALKVSAYQ